jgi:ABC-2 type transport system permease protein
MMRIGIEPRRVYAMVLRYWFYLRHSYDRLSDMFYWPMIDLLLWGLTSQYIRMQAQGQGEHILLMVISGLLFWIVVWRAQYEITVNFLSEIWDKNLVNIFVSPLRFNEWLLAVYAVGISKMAISFTFASLMAFLLYKVNVLTYGWYAPVFSMILMIMGWAVGMLVASVILRYGTKAQTLAWCAVMVVSPFSAIFYPLAILPVWAQQVARLVPASYVFENARRLVLTGSVNWGELGIALGIALIYFGLAFRLISHSFTKAKERGLIKVY